MPCSRKAPLRLVDAGRQRVRLVQAGHDDRHFNRRRRVLARLGVHAVHASIRDYAHHVSAAGAYGVSARRLDSIRALDTVRRRGIEQLEARWVSRSKLHARERPWIRGWRTGHISAINANPQRRRLGHGNQGRTRGRLKLSQ